MKNNHSDEIPKEKESYEEFMKRIEHLSNKEKEKELINRDIEIDREIIKTIEELKVDIERKKLKENIQLEEWINIQKNSILKKTFFKKHIVGIVTTVITIFLIFLFFYVVFIIGSVILPFISCIIIILIIYILLNYILYLHKEYKNIMNTKQ